uniref:Uncharacterized protein n=1 Tax=Phytophthora ramorum TaxID=164328 RepID=H3H8L1_PHYRM
MYMQATRKLVMLVAVLLMVAWRMLPVVDVMAVLRADSGSLAVVVVVGLLACKLVKLVALGKEVGLRILRVVETGGHIMFLVMVFMPFGQLKMVAASKVLAVTSALQLKMLALVARQRHQDEKTPLVQIATRRNKYYASQ